MVLKGNAVPMLAIVALVACTGASQQTIDETLDPGVPRAYAPDATIETEVLVPEVYELANVIIAITDHGLESRWVVNKRGEYYQRVLEHFRSHAGDELVRALDPLISDSYSAYYGFRENAFSYRFDGDTIVHAGRYFRVWPRPDLFARFLDQVQAFAAATDFRDFYASERAEYEDQIRRYSALIDLRGMAGWLHDRFPEARIHRYTLVFSPLIGGSHSTRNFARDEGTEAVMFVAGPDLSLGDSTGAIRRGLFERLVFTEIDHNYVNPVTDTFRARVDEVFRDWGPWNQSVGYRSPYETFNEYMTWAVFTLYAADAYDRDTFRKVVDVSERQMEKTRGFVRFRAFDRETLRLYRELEPATVGELYPAMLRWCAQMSD